MDERERKTEEEVDGQHKCRLGGDGTVGGGDARPGRDHVDATGQTHRRNSKL